MKINIAETIKGLYEKLPTFGFDPEVEKALGEYLLFVRDREDLLAQAQTWHENIFTERTYTNLELEQLQANDGWEKGLLLAVMYLARCDKMEELLAERGIPAVHAEGSLNAFKNQIKTTRERDGFIGLHGMSKYSIVKFLVPYQFYIGRLNFEITKFSCAFVLYKNKNDGSMVWLAKEGAKYREFGAQAAHDYTGPVFEPTLTETETEICGYAFKEDGYLDISKPVTLKTSEYERYLSAEDDVISVHIPANGKLAEDLVIDSFKQAKKFFDDHYPDYTFKSFMCSSWLLDKQLEKLVKPDSNIRKFQKLWTTVMGTANWYSIYWHVFDTVKIVPYEELEPKNSFQQTLLDFVKVPGNTLYNGHGIILWDQM